MKKEIFNFVNKLFKATPTNTINRTVKYIDWNKIQEIIKKRPNSVILAGIMEDWDNSSGLIFASGKHYNGSFCSFSTWGTPIIDVDGEVIECWSYKKTNRTSRLSWWDWNDGEELMNDMEYEIY